MEQYSRQFIEELAKHIDPAIADFFNMKHEIFKFPAKTFTELIDETLMDYLEGKTSREDLIPIVNKIKKSRLQKRARWYKSYINDVDTISIDDPKHPLSHIINMALLNISPNCAIAYGRSASSFIAILSKRLKYILLPSSS